MKTPLITKLKSGVSFQVSKVERAKRKLPVIKYEKVLRNILKTKPESYSRVKKDLVAKIYTHPFIGAAHLAFAHHYPLIISPDVVWLCLTQGLALHINHDPEQFRHHFVDYLGKKNIVIERNDFIKNSSENYWDEVLHQFSGKIAEHIGAQRDLIVCDFSTTGILEQTVSEIVLMDVVKHYFDYQVDTMCGIPEITLLGTIEDWQSIRRRVENFDRFGLEKWVDLLIPVLDRLITTANGEVNQEFWRSFYKFEDTSGGTTITGWINLFFPYIKDWQGNYTTINPYLVAANQDWHCPYLEGATMDCLPIGLSQVPFVWKYMQEIFEMNFIGGFVGVSQAKNSLALQTEIGWAITQNN